MKVELGHEKRQLFPNIDLFKETCFIFIPYNDFENYVYLMCLIKYDEDYIRVERRYFVDGDWNYFLSKTNLKPIYAELMNILNKVNSYSEFIKILDEMKKREVLVYEVKTRGDYEGLPPSAWTDFTTSIYSTYEPEGIMKFGEKVIEKSIEKIDEEIILRLKQGTVAGWQREFIGNTFTVELGEFSGNVYYLQNMFKRRGIASEIVSNRYSRIRGLNEVKFANGTILQSKFHLNRAGDYLLSSKIKEPNNRIVSNEISGNIRKYKDVAGVTRKLLNIHRMENYDIDNFSSFLTHAKHKFGKIIADITKMDVKQVGVLLLNGFDDNFKIAISLKSKLIKKLKKDSSGGKVAKKTQEIIDGIKKSHNISDLMNVIVKNKKGINNYVEIIADYLKNTKKKLSFSVVNYEKKMNVSEKRKKKRIFPVYKKIKNTSIY